jgi:tight adherence protein B
MKTEILYYWAALALIGVAVFLFTLHYNKQFLDWFRFQSVGTRDYIVDKLKLMFIDVPPHRVLLVQLMFALGPGLIFFTLILPHYVIGLLAASIWSVLAWKVPKFVVDYFYQKRVERFVNQMVDGLSLMSNGMKSGLSVVQSLGLVTSEMPNPIQQEFNLVLSQNKLGTPLEECLTSLSKRVVSDDVEMFVTSVNILKETGGNLAETFDTIVLTIRDRIKVEGKIQAMTAQARMQGMFLLGVPPMMLLLMQQSDPELMQPLFTTAFGWILLMIVLLLEVVALFVILKVVKIDV